MGKLVLELRTKLEKSRNRQLILAGLSMDNVFVGKVLNEFPLKDVKQNLKDTQITMLTEEEIEKIRENFKLNF